MKLFGVSICALSLLFLPAVASGQQNAFSFGYGFGFLNPNQHAGKIEGDRPYNFFQLAYAREIHLVKKFFLVLEPFIAYDQQPAGLDFGFTVLFRYRVPFPRENSLFLDVGGGGAYTTVDFREQGTHAVFNLQAGIGWKWKRFFIEDRFRHYSNGGLVSPNHSVHANIIAMGIHF